MLAYVVERLRRALPDIKTADVGERVRKLLLTVIEQVQSELPASS